MAEVGDRGTEHAVGPAPDELPGQRVQRIRAAVALFGVARSSAPATRTCGEVDEPVDHARSAVDRRRCFESPQPIAGACVEGHEESVVGADVDAPLPDGGRGVDVRAGSLCPEEPAARRPEGIERPVRVADEDPAGGDGRGRVEELATPEPRQRLRPPAQTSRACVQGVDAATVGTEIHLPVDERRRAIDLRVGGERPPGLPRVDVDRVELVVPGAGVERLADDERRGLEDARPVAPDDLPRPGRHRGDHPRLAPGVPVAGQRLHPRVVDDAVGDGGRSRRAVVEAALPDDLPGPVMDGIETPALLREVEAAVRDRRWELENVAGLERPAQPVRRAELEVRSRVRPLHAEAVGRPRQAKDDPARPRCLRRFRRLRRHELDGRRAALVLDRALLVEPDADEEARHYRGDRKAGQQQEPPCAHRRRTSTSAVSRRPETSTTSE